MIEKNIQIRNLKNFTEKSEKYQTLNKKYSIFKELYRNSNEITNLINTFNIEFGSKCKDILAPILQKDDDFICFNLENEKYSLINWEAASYLLIPISLITVTSLIWRITQFFFKSYCQICGISNIVFSMCPARFYRV